MDKVKNLISAGAPIPDAIRVALGEPIATAADRYRVSRSVLSNTINGRLAPSAKALAGLMEDLGGTEAEWRELLWRAGKPATADAPIAA